MKPLVGRIADIGGVVHASRLSYIAQVHLSIGRHSELRPVAEYSPQTLRFRSAPLSATEVWLMTLLLSSPECCASCRLPTTIVLKICVSRYTWSQMTLNHVRGEIQSSKKRAMTARLSLRVCNPPPA